MRTVIAIIAVALSQYGCKDKTGATSAPNTQTTTLGISGPNVDPKSAPQTTLWATGPKVETTTSTTTVGPKVETTTSTTTVYPRSEVPADVLEECRAAIRHELSVLYTGHAESLRYAGRSGECATYYATKVIEKAATRHKLTHDQQNQIMEVLTDDCLAIAQEHIRVADARPR